MKEKYYLTTAIAYASRKPHFGNTYEVIMAHAMARYKRLRGFDVFFCTGTDEHGQKIENLAKEAGITPKAYVDGVAAEIKGVWDGMNTTYDRFIRTTDDDHVEAVGKIFNRFYEQGDIYKGYYEGWYCTPCESFFTETQVVDGKCPDCGRPVQQAKEEALGFGYHIWVIDENGQKILVSRYNPDSYEEGASDLNLCNAYNWENWFGDALAFAIKGTGSVAIDNIAVWMGLGDMPIDKSTDEYRTLLKKEIDVIPEDMFEDGLVVVKNGEAKLYIVLPENADRNVLYAKDKFSLFINEKTGITLPFGTQIGNAYELLIGDTGREESIALKKTISGNQFAIKRDGNKIIIVATNDAFLYDAIEYLIKYYFTH